MICVCLILSLFLYREQFSNRVSKVIRNRNCSGFAVFRDVIGPGNLRHFLNQLD